MAKSIIKYYFINKYLQKITETKKKSTFWHRREREAGRGNCGGGKGGNGISLEGGSKEGLNMIMY